MHDYYINTTWLCMGIRYKFLSILTIIRVFIHFKTILKQVHLRAALSNDQCLNSFSLQFGKNRKRFVEDTIQLDFSLHRQVWNSTLTAPIVAHWEFAGKICSIWELQPRPPPCTPHACWVEQTIGFHSSRYAMPVFPSRNWWPKKIGELQCSFSYFMYMPLW